MQQGDVFLLAQTPAYVLASDPDLSPLDGTKVIDWTRTDIGRCGGDDVVLIGGSFRVNNLHEHVLSDALPHLLHLPRDLSSAVALSRLLEVVEIEFCRTATDSDLLRHHLADLLVVQMLRAFADRKEQDACGPTARCSDLIGALTDPRIGAALQRIHAEPGRKWTVKDLAEIAGMSRTSFSEAFHAAIGRPPIDYVSRWRMQVAETLIRQGDGIADVAHRLGYASQTAFGVAFKRLKGHPPRAALRGGEKRL